MCEVDYKPEEARPRAFPTPQGGYQGKEDLGNLTLIHCLGDEGEPRMGWLWGQEKGRDAKHRPHRGTSSPRRIQQGRGRGAVLKGLPAGKSL